MTDIDMHGRDGVVVRASERLAAAGFKSLAIIDDRTKRIGVGVSRIEPRLVRLRHAPYVGEVRDEFVVAEGEQVGFGVEAIANAMAIEQRFATLRAAAAHLCWLDGRISSRDLVAVEAADGLEAAYA